MMLGAFVCCNALLGAACQDTRSNAVLFIIALREVAESRGER
jgi:hypothetical protein